MTTNKTWIKKKSYFSKILAKHLYCFFQVRSPNSSFPFHKKPWIRSGDAIELLIVSNYLFLASTKKHRSCNMNTYIYILQYNMHNVVTSVILVLVFIQPLPNTNNVKKINLASIFFHNIINISTNTHRLISLSILPKFLVPYDWYRRKRRTI